jgi:predicted RNA-binding Zn-ribbon protein involved in translation (DUF1610 family)
MATEKQDPTFLERFVVPLLGIFLVSSLFGCVIIFYWKPEHEGLEIALFCGLIVVMITGLAVLHRKVLGHYRCPQCPTELTRHKDASRRAEYLFYCKNCDVIWMTGLQQGD